MIKKRFTLSDEKYDGTIFDNGESMGCIDVVDMLNAFNDENEQLKNVCKNLINEVNKRGITVTMSDSYRELLQ